MQPRARASAEKPWWPQPDARTSDRHQVDADSTELGWCVLQGPLEKGTKCFNQGRGPKRPAPAQPCVRGRIRLREREPG